MSKEGEQSLFGKGKITATATGTETKEKEKQKQSLKEKETGGHETQPQEGDLNEHETRCSSSDRAQGKGGKECCEFVPAECPVDGICVSKTGPHLDTPQAILKHGQRVFFCSQECCDKFKSDVPKFMREPGDLKWCEKPSMCGLTVACPECKTGGHLKVSESTPRILLKHGQTLWFCNFSCMASFLKNPGAAFQPSLTSSLAGMVLGEHRAPSMVTYCPVTGKKVSIEFSMPHVELKHGQRIYTCCSGCPVQLSRNLNAFIKHPHDPLVHPAQLPLNGLVQKCVHCPHTIVIDEEHTPRVQFRGGQNLFFHTNKCVDEFLAAPSHFLVEMVDPSCSSSLPFSLKEQETGVQPHATTSSSATSSSPGSSSAFGHVKK